MKIFVIAGEVSGDRLAASMIKNMQAVHPDIEFQGVAGPMMQDLGVQSLFPMHELSVMGVAEILPKYPALKKRLNQTIKAVLDFQPDALVTVDAPDFTLRVAQKVKRKAPHIKAIHYVAPTVWAWRAGRAKRMGRYIDMVLALLPFEVDFMRDAGMDCICVGHPIVSDPIPNEQDKAAFTQKYGLMNGQAYLALLPGSRSAELNHLLPVFTAVLRRPEFAELHLIIPTLPHLADRVTQTLEDLPQRKTIFWGAGISSEQAKFERSVAFSLCKGALAASGSVSLELAAVGTPMIIAYDFNWLSRLILPYMVQVNAVNMINLITDRHVIPECILQNCTEAVITPKLNKLLHGPNLQKPVLDQAMELLGRGQQDPGARAARAVLDYI